VLYGLNQGPGSPTPTHIVTIDPTTGIVDRSWFSQFVDAIAFLPGSAGARAGRYNSNGPSLDCGGPVQME